MVKFPYSGISVKKTSYLIENGILFILNEEGKSEKSFPNEKEK